LTCLLACFIFVVPVTISLAWTPGVPVVFTDPANDVYRGTTVDYLGDWVSVDDPAVDMLSISIGNGVTTGELTITVSGGLSLLLVDDTLAFCVSVNTTTTTYQMVMILYQSGAWSCAVLAVWDGTPTMDAPNVTVTDTTLQIVASGTYFDIDDGTTTAYAVRYVTLSPPVFNVDFYPDSHFTSIAPAVPTTLTGGIEPWVWGVIIATIVAAVVIVIVIVTRKGKHYRKSFHKVRARPRLKR